MTARSWSRDRECERVWKVFCQGGIFGAGLNLNMAFSGNFLHILPSLFQIWQLFVILKLRIKSQHFEKCSQPLPATCSASQASSMTARWCWTGSGRAQSLRGMNLVREELGLPGSLGHILETVLPWWRTMVELVEQIKRNIGQFLRIQSGEGCLCQCWGEA